MAGPTADLAPQILGLSPAAAMLGPNIRLKGQLGFMGTAVDVLTFSVGAPGAWIAPNTRTRTSGVFMVSQTSQGAQLPPPPAAPIPFVVISGDVRVRSL